MVSDNPLLQTDARIATTIAAGTYYIRIKPTGAGDPLATSIANGYTEYGSLGQYTIKGSYPTPPPLLEVLAPAAGGSFVIGSTQDITWEPSGISGNVKLELYLGGAPFAVLATGEPNDGSFSWMVPANLTEGSGYAIRISSVDDPLIASIGEIFSISAQAASALGIAVDAPDLVWSTTGLNNALWFSQTSETSDGTDAAQSGFIPNGFYFEPATSSLMTTVQGPGTVTFQWKVDSLNNHKLSFYVGNTLQADISGATNWASRTFSVPAGTQTLRWTYSKNFQQGAGRDSGWVDQVSYTPSGGQSLVVEQPAGTPLVSASSTIDFGAVALGATSAAKTFTLRNDGSGDLSDLSIAVMGEHGADFTAGALTTTTLAPGGSTTVDVSFSPSQLFERNAYLAIFSSDFGNSPFIVNLTGDTADVGTLEVQEVGSFLSSGELGSTNFAPSSRFYTLRNTGQQNLNWEVSSAAPWIRLPVTSGSLAPNETRRVFIEIDPAVASALTEYGDYSGTLHFSNTGDGRGDTIRNAFLSITKDEQIITFNELPGPVAIGDGSITLSASSTSGLPVSFSSSDSNVATVSGNTLTILGEGSVVITAMQDGDAQYAPATLVERKLAMLWAGQAPAIVYEPFDDGDSSLAGNTPGEGLSGLWSGGASVTPGSLSFGNLTLGRGNRATMTNLNGHVSTGTALTDAGLLADGATLWFSAIVEISAGINQIFGELGFAFGSEPINPNTNLPISNSGQALGFTFYKNRLRAAGWTPSLSRTQDFTAVAENSNSYLVVGKIDWASNRETIEIYLPTPGLVLGDPVSTYRTSSNFDQTTFDTISFGATTADFDHRIDEIRFGVSYESVVDFRVLTRYQAWANGTFANPFTDTELSANPDQDQFNNLQEYAFGTDPTSSAMNQLSYVVGGAVIPGAPVLEVSESGVAAGEFSVAFSRRKDFAASGLTYSAHFSADLQAWEEHSVIATVVDSSDPDYEVVKITFPSSVPLQSGGSAPPQFVRIGVE